jgi:hypothetical protein
MTIGKKAMPARAAAMRKSAEARMAHRKRLRELKHAMAEFDRVDVAEPAVKPDPEAAKAIRKAVREFYQERDALEHA